jgi:tRNA pseudouridine38-40 synthase
VRTIRLIVEYDGTAFAGWQIQKGHKAPTVQGALERAISKMTQTPVSVRGASRTDAGVHARGQVAVFKTDKDIPCIGFERGLGQFMPRGISIRRAEEVEDGWDPRRTSRGKRYRYTYWNDRTPSALERDRAWWVKVGRLEVAPMHEAAQVFLGTHDFEAFRSAGCSARHAVRTMYSARVFEGEHERVIFEIVGNAFVRNMVRIMAGNLCDVGLGRMTKDQLVDVLASKDRTRGGMTAPPHGLCLEEVIYDDRLPPRPKDGVDLTEADAGE